MRLHHAIVKAVTRRARLRAVAAAAVLAMTAWPGPALAAPTRAQVIQAEKLFNEARALMARNKFDAACPKLAESQKIDPAPGTKYQLAVCLENTGHPASALAHYVEVADLARAAGFKDREKVARDKADALEPKVPRIIIEVDAKARVSGLRITRNGAAVDESFWNKPILVDPGEYTIEATAPGKKTFTTSVVVQGEGTKVIAPIVMADAEPFGGRRNPDDDTPKPSSFGGQRIAATAVTLVGVGGAVVGAVFGLDAKSTYEKATKDPALCPTKTTCYPEGKRIVDQAGMSALISTIAFAAGGVGLVGGVVLFATSSSPPPSGPLAKGRPVLSATLVPVVAEGFGGALITGQF